MWAFSGLAHGAHALALYTTSSDATVAAYFIYPPQLSVLIDDPEHVKYFRP
jgi:hypothetical protein